ncbi:hypothetical protein BGZ73_003331 [Actinomortierella ambigua]|nr:hypothetical protein BGZ73_003331 [Actinomortierella ambigua]
MSTAALPPVSQKASFATEPQAAALQTKKRAKHHSRSSSSELLDEASSSAMQRSISTPTVASAAMVSSEQQALFEKQRQSQMMMTTYLSNAIKEKKSGNPTPYEELISQLTTTKPAPLPPSKLLQWIQALLQCISLLDKTCQSLIEALLQLDWTTQDDVFVQYYVSFMGNIVSAHPIYLTPVMSMLVGRFRQRSVSRSMEHNITPQRQFDRVHQAMKYILDLIPTASTTLFPLLASEFPHKRESYGAHMSYVKNILLVLEYAPVLRSQVLGVVIDRIIQIDVEIQVELEELEDSDTELVFEVELPEEEDSESDVDDSDSDSDSEADEVAVLNIKDMTNKLDGMLLLVLTYLNNYIESHRHMFPPDGTPPAPIQELFLVLLTVFMKTILHTFKSRHTQFLLFYLTSLSPQFSDYFLGALGQQILDKAQPQVLRVAAAAYMSSYVARAKFLDIRQIGMVIDMLGGFSLQVIEEIDTGSHIQPDAEKYAVFYAVVQAMLYIFCFRWRVLALEDTDRPSRAAADDDFGSAGMIVGSMDSPMLSTTNSAGGSGNGRQWHAGLQGLQRIVTSRLNPLKMCSENVVKQFARISHNLNFMYVYPILEQNKKVYVPPSQSAYQRALQTGSAASAYGGNSGNGNRAASSNNGSDYTIQPHELDTFFPFDPYRLKQSAHFMDNIYQEWENDEEDSDEEEDEEEDEEHDYDEDEDDEAAEDEEYENNAKSIGRHRLASVEEEDSDEESAQMNQSIMAMSISPSPAHFLVQGMNAHRSDSNKH